MNVYEGGAGIPDLPAVEERKCISENFTPNFVAVFYDLFGASGNVSLAVFIQHFIRTKINPITRQIERDAYNAGYLKGLDESCSQEPKE